MALRECPECGNWEGNKDSDGFEELDGDDMYKCNACGHEFDFVQLAEEDDFLE